MLINIKIFPSSGKQKIIKIDESNYKIYLKQVPEKNKANLELIDALAKYFNISKNEIIIKHGLKSRKKLIEIQNLNL